ncbi:MAG TPA: FkbM family methyltransferase [Stellaceae bacterium]|nr:FkbM family methyltransferase [Stellaceae bacterium]
MTIPAGRRGLRYGVAATVEHWRALGGLDIATVVDIGANKGQFALFATAVFPAAIIYSFEPLEEAAARFRKVFGEEVTLFETAIGPRETETAIYVSRRADSSSLLPITKQSQVFPGTELKEKRIIHVAPLTNYLRPENIRAPALLKIDVQGYELEVLSACELLLPLFQFVYVELSYVELYGGQALAGQVIRHLAEREFQLLGVYNQSTDPYGKPVQADFLFANPRSR